ncbi:hypothetical protein RSAG8_00617, partial [Rhizoctonia solani AG-8 WAC10335]
MSINSIFILLELVSLAAALPAGGSGGSRDGSKGGTKGGSSGGSGGSSSTSGGKNGSGWTSSRNKGSRSSGPLSKTAKIVLAVIGGIILLIILLVLFKVLRDRYKRRKEAKVCRAYDYLRTSFNGVSAFTYARKGAFFSPLDGSELE